MYPKARTEDLSIRPLDDDTLIMDKKTRNVHCLNRMAYRVYSFSDGEHSVSQITDLLCENGLPATNDTVELALQQLVEKGLVEFDLGGKSEQQLVNRREAVKMMAKMAAVPVVLSLSTSLAAGREICYEESRETWVSASAPWRGKKTTVYETCLEIPDSE